MDEIQKELQQPYKEGTMQRRKVLELALGGIVMTSLQIFLPSQVAYARKADSIEVLNDFLNHVQALRANFKQVVVSPNSKRTQTSSGTFVLSRPNRFRFNYLKPYEQQIVSDGVNLWLYDVDLEQVTQRPYSAAMDSTPAALLAGGAQATMAQKDFTLKSMPDKDGLQWVQGLPTRDDGQLKSARIGFRNKVLAVLEIIDNFGQTSTLTFTDVELNPSIDDEIFTFKMPAGIDLIQG